MKLDIFSPYAPNLHFPLYVYSLYFCPEFLIYFFIFVLYLLSILSLLTYKNNISCFRCVSGMQHVSCALYWQTLRCMIGSICRIAFRSIPKGSRGRGKERTRANRRNGWSNLILTKLAKKIGSRSEMAAGGIAAALRANRKPCPEFVKRRTRDEALDTRTRSY